MTRRHRNSRLKPSRETAPGWLWMLAGMLVGALVMTLVRLKDVEPEPKPEAVAENSQPQEHRPRFDFYTLLKETEVIVPDPPAPQPQVQAPPEPRQAQKEAPARSAATAPTSTGETFLLQAGSFKSARDADSLRARLLLLNLNASVQQVSPRAGETWHRVLVGPFSSSASVSEARAMLARNGIDNILIKRK